MDTPTAVISGLLIEAYDEYRAGASNSVDFEIFRAGFRGGVSAVLNNTHEYVRVEKEKTDEQV